MPIPFDQRDPFERLAILRDMLTKVDALQRELRRAHETLAVSHTQVEQRVRALETELSTMRSITAPHETIEDLLEPPKERPLVLREPTFLEMLQRRQNELTREEGQS